MADDDTSKLRVEIRARTWKELDKARFRTKVFVKASDEAHAEQKKAKSDHERRINGDEAKSFYDDVLTSEKETKDEGSESAASDSALENLKKTVASSHQRSVRKRRRTLTEKDMFLAAQANDADKLQECLEEVSDIDSCDQYGWSALMMAASAGSLDAVQLLLEAGADVSVVDKSGNTCLRLAKIKGHRDVADLIINHNAQLLTRRAENVEAEDGSAAKSFFCEECKMTFVESTYLEHLSSTVHQISSGAASFKHPTYYGLPESNRGFQMMLSKGWDREGGLGPDGKKGKKFPVKTVLKRDRQGIGAEGANIPRVSHFKPNDPASVQNPRRIERAATLDKRKREERQGKEKVRSIRYSRELSGL